MFIQGRCSVIELPIILKDAMTSIPAGETTPMWEMISSRAENHASEDGYVFHSKGEDGKQDIFIGFHNENRSYSLGTIEAAWNGGHRYFVAEGYEPGEPGQNGKFKNKVHEAFFFHFSRNTYYTAKTAPLSYWASITKERVIIAIKSDIGDSHARTNVMHLGRIVPFDPEDTRAVGLACGMGHYMNNGNGYMRMVTHNSGQGAPNNYRLHSALQETSTPSKGWGNNIIAAPIFAFPSLSTGYTSMYRGVLDCLIVRNQDNKMRPIDTVEIDGQEYLSVSLEYRQTFSSTSSWYHNNFSFSTVRTCILIPKK